MSITSTRPDIQAIRLPTRPKRSSIRKPIVALLAVAAVLVAGIAVAAVMTTRSHTGPTHNVYWRQGYSYGQTHTAAASSAPQPTAQWCALMAYQASGYTHLKQEGDWAHGCTAALARQ